MKCLSHFYQKKKKNVYHTNDTKKRTMIFPQHISVLMEIIEAREKHELRTSMARELLRK